MMTSEQCKAHAAECRQLAETAASRQQKALLSNLAYEWEMTARHMERMEAQQNGEAKKYA
jgi:hypothetical protein